MAIFNREREPAPAATVPQAGPTNPPTVAPLHAEPAEPPQLPLAPSLDAIQESLVAADLTVEGNIQGVGDVRIAGRFVGDVRIDGQLTIEPGAHVQGSVHAKHVVIAGELQGNIESAARVELLASSVLLGDAKAAAVIVAAGARVRGHVAFGWADEAPSVGTSSQPNTAQEITS